METDRLLLSAHCNTCGESVPVMIRVSNQEHVKLDKEYLFTSAKMYTPCKCPSCGASINYIWSTNTFGGDEEEKGNAGQSFYF